MTDRRALLKFLAASPLFAGIPALLEAFAQEGTLATAGAALDALVLIGVHRNAAGDPEEARAIWTDVIAKYQGNPHVKPVEALFLHRGSA
jgi:hypothetical protein